MGVKSITNFLIIFNRLDSSIVSMKIANDIREFIKILESQDQLRRVKTEVNWNLEIGAITRRNMDLKRPAILFEKIKDYPKGFRILASPFGPTKPVLQGRVALALGEHKSTSPLELIDIVQERIKKPIKPKIVNDGLCKENIVKGKDVDVLRFPNPLISNIDGGRYIGTWNVVVTKDPVTDVVNWGVYRVMIQDGKTLSILMHKAFQHGGEVYHDKYEKGTKSMPIAIAIGTDPLSAIASATSFPRGVSEVDMVGALRGSALEVVKCETIDLEVPSSSEVIIEGEIPPGKTMWEGPFGEYTGHIGSGKMLMPVIKIKCITHRNQPIISTTNMGKPWHDANTVFSIMYSANARQILWDRDIPIKNVYVMPGTDSLVISAKSSQGLAHRIINTLRTAGCRTSGSYTFIVNEDIDVTDFQDVFWCFTTRMHPKNGIHTFTVQGGNPLIPHLTPEERDGKYSSQVYFDCTFPANWSREYLTEHCSVIDFEHAWPEAVKKRVMSRWASYGLD